MAAPLPQYRMNYGSSHSCKNWLLVRSTNFVFCFLFLCFSGFGRWPCFHTLTCSCPQNLIPAPQIESNAIPGTMFPPEAYELKNLKYLKMGMWLCWEESISRPIQKRKRQNQRFIAHNFVLICFQNIFHGIFFSFCAQLIWNSQGRFPRSWANGLQWRNWIYVSITHRIMLRNCNLIVSSNDYLCANLSIFCLSVTHFPHSE